MSNTQHYPTRVPNDCRADVNILFVGEAPGETELQQRKPFVGESGNLFITCLNRAGRKREEVNLANLCQYRPYGNDFKLLLDTPVFREGLAELYDYIQIHKPTVIGALGAWPLQFLTGKKGIEKWRGSILSYINDPSIKVIATVHPAAVLRDRGQYPIFDADIKRIVGDSAFPEKRLPVREFVCDPRGLDLESWTQKLCAADILGVDIETVKNSRRILCCGFAPSPGLAVCINAEHEPGRQAIARILASPTRKIFQFGTYDTIQLCYLNGYELFDTVAQELGRPYYWDTLVAQHVLAPELPRSLEYLTSVYTREPYYKTVGRGTIPDDEKGWNERTVVKQSLYEYNCRDCCVTIEIALEQAKELAEEPIATRAIFDFEMELVGITREISNAGMLVDEERRAIIETTLLRKWAKKQFALDRLTGFETNVRSPKLKVILYDNLGLPTRRNRKGGITTDEDAIVSLITYCKDHISNLKQPDAILDWQVKLAICHTILEIRGIRQTLSNYVLIKGQKGIRRINDDGRIRSTYRIGPNTGRLSASKYVDGSGFAAQTMPRDPIEVLESELLVPVSQALVMQLDDEHEEGELFTSPEDEDAAA